MKNTKGFTLIEGLLILVMVSALAGIGWYVWRAKSNSNKSLDNTASTGITAASDEGIKEKNKKEKELPNENQKVDRDLFSIEFPKNWVESDKNEFSGIDGVSRIRYENKETGEFFQVDIDQTGRGALYGDYNWYYLPDSNRGTLKLTPEDAKCTEENQDMDTCPEDDSRLTIYILPYERDIIKLTNHTYHFLAGNMKQQEGQDLQVFRNIIASFKFK